MRYNPQIHHRRSIRLKGYDYAKAGAYFITICCHKMECRFGQIMTGTDNVGAPFTGAHLHGGQIVTQKTAGHYPNINPPVQLTGGHSAKRAPVKGAPTFNAAIPQTDACMQLNQYGSMAYNEWLKLPERFPNVELDVFQIMPNHMHGIIILTAPATDPAQNDKPAILGDIIGAYKSLAAKGCLNIY